MGGTDDIRRKILHVLYNYNKEAGPERPWFGPVPASAPPSREKPSNDDQRVAVVEPDEASDLL